MRVQPPGRVDENRIASLGFARRDGVEHHRGRIGAFPRANQIHAGTLGPDLQLLDRRGAERVGSHTSGFLPDAFSSCASFPTVVVLPVPLTPTISTTCGRCPLIGAGAGHGREDRADLVLDRVAQALSAALLLTASMIARSPPRRRPP